MKQKGKGTKSCRLGLKLSAAFNPTARLVKPTRMACILLQASQASMADLYFEKLVLFIRIFLLPDYGNSGNNEKQRDNLGIKRERIR